MLLCILLFDGLFAFGFVFSMVVLFLSLLRCFGVACVWGFAGLWWFLCCVGILLWVWYLVFWFDYLVVLLMFCVCEHGYLFWFSAIGLIFSVCCGLCVCFLFVLIGGLWFG